MPVYTYSLLWVAAAAVVVGASALFIGFRLARSPPPSTPAGGWAGEL